MKKLLLIFLAFLSVQWTYAKTLIGDLYYDLDSSSQTASVTYKSSDSSGNSTYVTGKLVIPEKVAYGGQSYSVTSIGNYAFDGCSGLTNVVIGNSVISIGRAAFYGCSSLTSVVIPNSVTSIGASAFYGCTGLETITIPESLIYMGPLAFYTANDYDRGRLTTVYYNAIDCTFESEYNNSYYYIFPPGIRNVIIGENVKKIPTTFIFYSEVTSITIPNSVTEIGYGAFYNCSSLETLIFEIGEENLTFGSNSGNLGSYFTNCKIKNLYIGRPINFYGYTDRWEETAPFIGATIESATINSPNICSYLFYGQNDLLNVEFLATITSISKYAFYGCKSLKDLTIPSSITTIEENAFSNCTRLTTVNSYALEPPTCKSNSFAETPCDYLHVLPQALKAYHTAPVWKEFGSIIGDLGIFIEYNNMLFGLNETDNTAELIMADESVTIANIPSSVTKDGKTYSVTSIAQAAFEGCDNLSSVTIPESVTVTYGNCFKELNNLKTITINDGDSQLYVIGEINVPKLEILTLGRELYKGKTQINGENVECNPSFANIATLTSLNFGKNIKTILKGMFSGCINLRSVTIPGNIQFIGDEAFANCVALKSINLEDSESPVTIESATTGAGTGTTFGGDPIETIYLGRNVEYIGTELSPFKNLTTLTSLTIGNKTTALNDYLFYGCTNIEMMAVPSSVKTIGAYTFYDCNKAKLLTISRSVESIGEYAFYNCRNLTSLTIPSSVVTIGDYAFRSCSGLNSISIGDGVKTIGNYAFLDCYMATNITIGNSVQTIGEIAFYNCQSWSNIVVPNSVNTIGANAFALCQGADQITIGSGVKSIGERAFADCDYITKIKSLSAIPPVAYDNTFTSYDAILSVPQNTLDSYRTSTCWKNFKTIINDLPAEIPATGITITPSTPSELTVGQTLQLTAAVSPENATNKTVTWESSDISVANVDPQGLVTAVSPGSVVIIASDAYGHKASIMITVVTNEYDGIETVVMKAKKFSIYNVSGILIKKDATQDDIHALSPGIYIIGGRKMVVK